LVVTCDAASPNGGGLPKLSERTSRPPPPWCVPLPSSPPPPPLSSRCSAAVAVEIMTAERRPK
jgi:hypothetical protein